MGKGKQTNRPGAPAGMTAKKSHRRKIMDKIHLDIAKPNRRQLTSKHRAYYELVENADKKKKLEYKTSMDRQPPPGFEFVPVGNAALTNTCKEMSRAQDAMIFIVSPVDKYGWYPNELDLHLCRLGYHMRQNIVDEARRLLGQEEVYFNGYGDKPEPISESQEEIYSQADAAIRELFPRIPNFDRHQIIQRAFNKAQSAKKERGTVGLAADIPLAHRVQLAVLAHIRHTHTSYDQLLREGENRDKVRAAIRDHCLKTLIKWRGDEENGRDQMDEILREVVVISDSESEDDSTDEDNEDDEDHASSDSSMHSEPSEKQGLGPAAALLCQPRERRHLRAVPGSPKVNKRGFGRYQDALEHWQLDGHNEQYTSERTHGPGIMQQPSQGTQHLNMPGRFHHQNRDQGVSTGERHIHSIRTRQELLSHGWGHGQNDGAHPHLLPQPTVSQWVEHQHPFVATRHEPMIGERSEMPRTQFVRVSREEVDLKDHLVNSIEVVPPGRAVVPGHFHCAERHDQPRGPYAPHIAFGVVEERHFAYTHALPRREQITAASPRYGVDRNGPPPPLWHHDRVPTNIMLDNYPPGVASIQSPIECYSQGRLFGHAPSHAREVVFNQTSIDASHHIQSWDERDGYSAVVRPRPSEVPGPGVQHPHVPLHFHRPCPENKVEDVRVPGKPFPRHGPALIDLAGKPVYHEYIRPVVQANHRIIQNQVLTRPQDAARRERDTERYDVQDHWARSSVFSKLPVVRYEAQGHAALHPERVVYYR